MIFAISSLVLHLFRTDARERPLRRVAGDQHGLVAIRRAGRDREAGFGEPERACEKLDNRLIGLALFRLRPDFDGERHMPVGGNMETLDLIARRFGRDAQETSTPSFAARQGNSGKAQNARPVFPQQAADELRSR